ncbi:MAG: 4Fe-4S binding protein [Candidatus Coatesbacteria bacterium]|nr:4Fe-4S binding protein [Candidatus Coatesbacteria bacterium]
MNRDYFHSVRIIDERCNGCTHCIRACETEAIRVRHGKAIIHEVRCIDCGECIRICPRNAAVAASDDLSELKRFSYNVALPSTAFTAQCPSQHKLNKLYNGLLHLGFNDVFEESRTNSIISYAVNKFLKENARIKPYISSVCPAVVRLIQVRFPSLVEHIIPIETPLEISARIIREQKSRLLGIEPEKLGIFYITTCPARVTAIKQPVGTEISSIDGAIAICNIINKILVFIDQVEEKENFCKAPPSANRWGAVGGEVRALDTDKTLSVDGISNVVQVLNKVENYELEMFDFIEAYACPCGCVGGVLNFENPYVAKQRIYIQGKSNENIIDKEMLEIAEEMYENKTLFLAEEVEPRPVLKLDTDMRKAIQKLEKLERILKDLPGIDCGACGCPTCRALAEDIVQGNANIEDCIFIRK